MDIKTIGIKSTTANNLYNAYAPCGMQTHHTRNVVVNLSKKEHMKIQQINSLDYDLIISNVNEWWGGRNMTDMLPRLFFKYFNDTSFIIKDRDSVLGFIIGFISQTNSEKAYVHFIGVNPDYRNKGIGKMLYNHFFQVVSKKNVHVVECLTSLINKSSIRFHTKIGFDIVSGDSVNDEGISFFKDYDGKGEDRVRFRAETGLKLTTTKNIRNAG